MIKRRTLASALPLLLALPGGVPAARAAATASSAWKRGLNLDSWFIGRANVEPLTEADFVQIRAAGFDHVRLPVRPEAFGYEPSQDGQSVTITFPAVEAAIALAIANNLAVDLNIQLLRDHKMQVEQDDRAAARYVALAAGVARRLAAYPAANVAFEPLNEFPFYRDTAKFDQFQRRVHKAVRAELPNATIILGGPMGSGLKGLGNVLPVDDANVIYAFHYYEPFIISHQGVTWGAPDWPARWFRDVPYPSSLVQPGVNYAPDAADRAKADAMLADYVSGNWNRAKIADRIKLGADWSAKYRTRVICNEFGAFRLHIDPASRYRWIGDVRAALEANGIGWSLWDYADQFGITDMASAGDQAKRVFEPAALQALFS